MSGQVTFGDVKRTYAWLRQEYLSQQLGGLLLLIALREVMRRERRGAGNNLNEEVNSNGKDRNHVTG